MNDIDHLEAVLTELKYMIEGLGDRLGLTYYAEGVWMDKKELAQQLEKDHRKLKTVVDSFTDKLFQEGQN